MSKNTDSCHSERISCIALPFNYWDSCGMTTERYKVSWYKKHLLYPT